MKNNKAKRPHKKAKTWWLHNKRGTRVYSCGFSPFTAIANHVSFDIGSFCLGTLCNIRPFAWNCKYCLFAIFVDDCFYAICVCFTSLWAPNQILRMPVQKHHNLHCIIFSVLGKKKRPNLTNTGEEFDIHQCRCVVFDFTPSHCHCPRLSSNLLLR